MQHSGDHGRLAFNEYLHKNLADEYLMFWHAVEVSKRETEQEKLRPLVYDLYNVFLKVPLKIYPNPVVATSPISSV